MNLLKIISKRENIFNIFIGDKVLGIKDSALLLKFYIKIGSNCVPGKYFIGMPFVTLSWLLGTLIKIKDNVPAEVYIHNSGYVLVLIKNEDKITVFYRWKYRVINNDSTNLIRSELRLKHTKNKKIYESDYLVFARQIYSIGTELEGKFKNKEKTTSGEYDFEISLNKYEKYLRKIEKDSMGKK